MLREVTSHAAWASIRERAGEEDAIHIASAFSGSVADDETAEPLAGLV